MFTYGPYYLPLARTPVEPKGPLTYKILQMKKKKKKKKHEKDDEIIRYKIIVPFQ